ncbi:choice-of-anchor I family protein [Aquibacillus kalidii]|uniref:choice-of-anchor I family protein n=1 Tax=Aquibacillus kalidii TaxID=2762597 RepID=UPI00164684A2|nr:choice-of-anchor I family protein [Aquibacillus kalidii]
MKSIKSVITKSAITAASFALLFSPIQASAAEDLSHFSKKNDSLAVDLVGRYVSGAGIDEGGTEIVAYDAKSYRAFSVNGAEKSLDIIDLSNLKEGNTEIPLVKRITLSDIGVSAGDVTSVAISPNGDYIAIAAPAEAKQDPGHIVFLTLDGESLASVQVGSLPDMVTFSPDGTKVLVANEGEPTEDYTVNPEGSVSIIDVAGEIRNLTDSHVTTVRFSEDVIDANIRKVHPDSSYAQDLEPEYISVDPSGDYAYVALQEDNAIAKLDINNAKFVTVKSLGYKDYSVGENQLDASDKDDQINIQHWPVLSIYQPDSITTFEANGQTYILSANEGDTQDWDGFSEEVRVEDLVGEDSLNPEQYELNADLYEGYTQAQLDEMISNGLFNKDQLGRLKTSTSHPKNANGKYEAIYGYGGRSFSVWNADTLELVYDSGSDFEQLIQEFSPDYFHSQNDEDNFDSRSDDKGVEPESVITGEVNDTPYAFVGLERQGGIMVYDMSNPDSPTFNSYFSSRIFQGEDTEVTGTSGDVAPEGLTFIQAEDSPTGQALLLAAHEVSGTIAAYGLGEKVEVPEDEEEDSTTNPTPVREQPDPTSPTQTPAPDETPVPEQPEQENPNKVGNETSTVETDHNNNKSEVDDDENSSKKQGNELPNTATTTGNLLLSGIVTLFLGYVLFTRKKISQE